MQPDSMEWMEARILVRLCFCFFQFHNLETGYQVTVTLKSLTFHITNKPTRQAGQDAHADPQSRCALPLL